MGLIPFIAFTQKNDSAAVNILKEVKVTGFKTVRGTGHMPELKDGIIYAGKNDRCFAYFAGNSG